MVDCDLAEHKNPQYDGMTEIGMALQHQPDLSSTDVRTQTVLARPAGGALFAVQNAYI